jgi:two-component system response regulator (stage 0 sporulation protein F)
LSVHSILIVDDDVQFGVLIKRVISSMGHDVEQISNPREIIDCYDKFAPDVIFLDIYMPVMHGMEVANWLSEKRFNGQLVFMTGRDPALMDAVRSSVDPHIEADVATLEKPARVNEIREILK